MFVLKHPSQKVYLFLSNLAIAPSAPQEAFFAHLRNGISCFIIIANLLMLPNDGEAKRTFMFAQNLET